MTTNDDMQARHDLILGSPPRIPPVDRQANAEQVQATTQRLRGNVVAGEPLPLDKIPEIMFTMCKFQDVWDKQIDLTIEIQGARAVLAVRDRKLAILRTGWLCQAPYEFGEHVNQSHRAGFTEDEVERIIVGSTAPGWSDHERAILKAVEELHADAMVSDETWDQLAKGLSEHQLTELLILIGQFVATAYFQNSMRLRLEPGNKGLFAR